MPSPLVALAVVLFCGIAQAAEPFLTQALEINNELRQSAASSPAQPLTLDPTLCQAAQDYANLQARNGTQGHFADGDPEQRARRAGFTGTLRTPPKHLSPTEKSYGLGEVLAYGHRDVQLAFDGWMHSKKHREALLETTYNRAGYGVAVGAGGQLIWVGMLGRVE